MAVALGHEPRPRETRGIVVNFAILIASLALAGCGTTSTRLASSSPAASPSTPVQTKPQLPARVADWFQSWAATSALGRATSADWVLTSHVKAEAIASGDIVGDDGAVYLFDVHGHFEWNHRCPAGAPPSSCVSVGTHQVFTLDAQRLAVLDFSVQQHRPKLRTLGTVGHEPIRDPAP